MSNLRGALIRCKKHTDWTNERNSLWLRSR